MTEPDLILADIIQTELGLPSGRVVAYAENWEPPKDSGIYVTIQTEPTHVIGSNVTYDPVAKTETKSVSCAQRLTVNITSRDRSALERKEELVMALTSTYSQMQQDANQVRINREGDIMDLSFIEASKALHRYQVPVKIFYLKSKTSPVTFITQFPSPQIQEAN